MPHACAQCWFFNIVVKTIRILIVGVIFDHVLEDVVEWLIITTDS